jgi:AcrR family transcriptional regulator
MGTPAYTRLENDERRRLLLELGTRLFTEHAYDEISMAQIAREAGISKALLYHYFPSKQDYFMATLAGGAEALRMRVEPDPALPPAQALATALDAYLAWIEDNAEAYAKLFRSASGVPEVRELVEGVRAGTAERILEGLGAADRGARLAVVHGRGVPGLDRPPRPVARRAPRPAARDPGRSAGRGRRDLPGRLGGGAGQRQHEPGAAVLRRLDAHGAAVGLGDLADDGQAQPRA